MEKTVKEYLISNCPSCGSELTFDGIHLMCNNETCPGRVGKQLATNAKLIDIKGIGPKTIESFSEDFDDLIDVIVWVKNYGNTREIENYGIKYESRSHEVFLSSFNNIKSITYGQAIVILGFNNVGLKLADQVANYYFDKNPDFAGHDRSVVSMLCSDEIREKIEAKVKKLKSCGIVIDLPSEKIYDVSTLFACMTGSPKAFGFNTKEIFASEFNGKLIDVSLSDKTCKYLITDDYGSTSSKMIIAKKKNIEILTYGDFFENYKTN